MKKIIISAVMATGVLVLAGCGYVSPSPANPSPGGTSSSGQTAATANAVTIQNFAFNPATLTVKKGATVTWMNSDSVPHQIKSTTFNSSQLTKGQSFSFTFNETGTFDYSCAIHPSMMGKIIVQ